MSTVAVLLLVLVGLLHLYFLVLEMFLWTRPLGLKTFRNTPEKAAATRALAATQGLYKGSLAAGSVGIAISAGLLAPRLVLAAWNEAAFQAKDVPSALTSLLGSDAKEASDAIQIKAPDIAENGAVVPIGVASTLPNVTMVAIMVEKNPTTLAASFTLPAGTEPNIQTRVKMGQTSNVFAVVKSDGKFFMTSKEIKVTLGGCGG